MAWIHPLDRLKHKQAMAGALPTAMAQSVKAEIRKTRIDGIREQAEVVFTAAMAKIQVLENIDQRRKVKTEALAKLGEYVEYYRASGAKYPNAPAVYASVWALDVGDIERGLNWALYLLGQGQQLPSRFSSSYETFLCDSVYDWARDKLEAQQSASPYLEQLIDAMEAGDWRLHPAVASKMYAIKAKHAKRADDWPCVYDYCQKAIGVNAEKHGVKTLFNEAAARLGKSGLV